MRFVVDTNAVSEFRKGNKADTGFREWADRVAINDLAISVVTLQELETGILLVARNDQPQALVFRAWLDHFVRPQFRDRILPIDNEIAIRCAPLHVPHKRPYPDSLIAATALVHDLTLVTRNVSHFKPMGVRLLNPWGA
ncbi:type II toxin-antitoxin system VapC family toxin [Devosia sp.]|uniref:type II toxin-antitoxin system VapC family toxin n=1 Tax=Devosia sp. TaxID=1871048 RepID=UPI002F1CAA9A